MKEWSIIFNDEVSYKKLQKMKKDNRFIIGGTGWSLVKKDKINEIVKEYNLKDDYKNTDEFFNDFDLAETIVQDDCYNTDYACNCEYIDYYAIEKEIVDNAVKTFFKSDEYTWRKILKNENSFYKFFNSIVCKLVLSEMEKEVKEFKKEQKKYL